MPLRENNVFTFFLLCFTKLKSYFKFINCLLIASARILTLYSAYEELSDLLQEIIRHSFFVKRIYTEGFFLISWIKKYKMSDISNYYTTYLIYEHT